MAEDRTGGTWSTSPPPLCTPTPPPAPLSLEKKIPSHFTPKYPSIYLSVYLSICLPVCLSICLSIYLSIYLYLKEKSQHAQCSFNEKRSCASGATDMTIGMMYTSRQPQGGYCDSTLLLQISCTYTPVSGTTGQTTACT